MDNRLGAILDNAAASSGLVVALTGAGISAESGIPTFRGKEGFWTVGSKDYHPQEMATWRMFSRHPEQVWPWYLYRRSICRDALPNPGHEAVVALEQAFGDRFVLATQNVDGLHIRAGNSLARTYQIHGNVDYMRCAEECTPAMYPVPEGVQDWPKDRALTEDDVAALTCPKCGASSRPHVLWFDECYDEEHYRFESSLRAAAQAAVLLVVGTAGATNLPNQMVGLAARCGAAVVDVNPENNPFARVARQLPNGYAATGTSGALMPEIAERLIAGA